MSHSCSAHSSTSARVRRCCEPCVAASRAPSRVLRHRHSPPPPLQPHARPPKHSTPGRARWRGGGRGHELPKQGRPTRLGLRSREPTRHCCCTGVTHPPAPPPQLRRDSPGGGEQPPAEAGAPAHEERQVRRGAGNGLGGEGEGNWLGGDGSGGFRKGGGATARKDSFFVLASSPATSKGKSPPPSPLRERAPALPRAAARSERELAPRAGVLRQGGGGGGAAGPTTP